MPPRAQDVDGELEKTRQPRKPPEPVSPAPGPPGSHPRDLAPRDDVRARLSPVRCPFCHVDLATLDGGWVACRGCLARHHVECWRESSRCASCGSPDHLEAPRRGPRGLALALIALVPLVFAGVLLLLVSPTEKPPAPPPPPVLAPALPPPHLDTPSSVTQFERVCEDLRLTRDSVGDTTLDERRKALDAWRKATDGKTVRLSGKLRSTERDGDTLKVHLELLNVFTSVHLDAASVDAAQVLGLPTGSEVRFEGKLAYNPAYWEKLFEETPKNPDDFYPYVASPRLLPK